MTNIFNIKEEFQKVKPLAGKVGFLFNNKYKKQREKYILGSFINLIEKSGNNTLIYASEKEPPDFIVYDINKNPKCNIEIVEVIHPGRNRGDEYKKGIFKIDYGDYLQMSRAAKTCH